MNEATFEAALNTALAAIFPALTRARITHQTHLTLRLGHNVVVSRGDLSKKAKGRLDVLVSVDGTPAVLLELKAPGRGVVSDDIEQARSYARLLNPMPPLFGVSDGATTRLFRTYDGTEWSATTVDDKQLQSLLADALACAAADHDDAVRLLLGRRPSLWAQVLRKETETALGAIEGDAADFSRPLARSFSIPRTAVRHLQSLIEQHPLVVVTGPPLCGKTNVLAQLCRLAHPNVVPVYVDAAALRHGVWQHLGDVFSLGLFRATSAEDARLWALSSLRDLSGPSVVLVIDAWRPTENDQVRADLEEIVGRLPLGSLRILLALDDADFDRIARVPGRATKTPIGRIAKELRIDLLDEAEFEGAVRSLHDAYRAAFYPGSQHNRELRLPRLLRIHAALMARGPDSHADPPPPGEDMEAAALLPAITSVDLLDSAWRSFTGGHNDDLRSDLERLASVWVDAPRAESPEAVMAFEQLGRSAQPIEALETLLGLDRLTRLRQQGLLRPIEIRAGHFMIMRVPELLAAAGAAVICRRLMNTELDAAYPLFLRATQRFPLSDVVGASVLLRCGDSVRLVDGIVRHLLKEQPTATEIGSDARAMFIAAEGSVPLPPPELSESPLRAIGNTHPALVLSQLAAYPMTFGDAFGSDVDGRSPNATIIAKVGSIPHLLRRIDTIPIGEMRPIREHHVSDGITVVCHNEGLIEPIVQASLFHLLREPEETRELAEWAVGEDRAHLVWRLRTAASLASTVVDAELAAEANAIEVVCMDYWRCRFDAAAH
jgi:hypothetical protein